MEARYTPGIMVNMVNPAAAVSVARVAASLVDQV